MTKLAQEEKKKTNPFLWILFAIVIPFVIIIVIISIILGIAGFNVIDWAKEKGSEIPVISSFVPSEEEASAVQQLERMTETLSNRDEEIEQLKVEIANIEAHAAELEQEVLQKDQVIESQEELASNAAFVDEEDSTSSITEIAKTYEEMKPKNAAAILELMDEAEVLAILQEMPNDVRGSILQAMEVEFAANMTELLINEQ